MSCKDIKIDIPLVLANELPPDQKRDMLRHIEECVQCHEEMEEFKKTWKLMDRWEIKEPSVRIESGLMAAAREELRAANIPLWVTIWKSFAFQTVVGAIAFSMIIHFILPYDKIINLCETNILKGAFLANFPEDLIFFVLGLLYGLVTVSISGLFFSRTFEGNPMLKGLGIGSIFCAFLVPFFILQCPEFSLGLIFVMVLGMIAGAISGGTGTLWVLNRSSS